MNYMRIMKTILISPVILFILLCILLIPAHLILNRIMILVRDLLEDIKEYVEGDLGVIE